MDPRAAAEDPRAQNQQVLTSDALQAALAALLPGAPVGATQLLSLTAPHALLGHVLQVQSDQSNSTKQPAKRKVTRTNAEDAPGAATLPRPPPIKHEVYEDLEEKFNQMQAEREPKRHRGNPKGYQIKSFCKNPSCGKQLNGGRTNRCEHCGFDLASHRRNSQLERLIKSGPLPHAQVRTALRDTANEVHVRTGGKAVVLTLVYMEGGGQAPAQAIAYGKPAAAFVESRKELITSFEALCRDHFKEQQAPSGSQQQPQLLQLGAASIGTPSVLSGPQLSGSSHAASAAAAAAAAASRPPCPLGPGSQLLSTVNAAAAALVAAAAGGGTGASQLGPLVAGGSPLGMAAPVPPSQPVDLESVIACTLTDPGVAIARCRDARVSGDVLARLPQAMQLTVLMQAGLLPGEAASVVVELESRQRIQHLPALSLAAALSQQWAHQHHQPAAPAAAPMQPAPPPHSPPPVTSLVQTIPQQPSVALQPPPPQNQMWVTGPGNQFGPGPGPGGITLTGTVAAATGSVVAGGIHPYSHSASSSSMVVPSCATAAAAVHTGGIPLLGPLQGALVPATAGSTAQGTDSALGQDSAAGAGPTAGVATNGPNRSHVPLQPPPVTLTPHHQLQGMLGPGIPQAGTMPSVAGLESDMIAGHPAGMQPAGQLHGQHLPQPLQPQL